MAFLSGRVSYLRFRIEGRPPDQFSEEQLEQLYEFRAGRQRIASADGIEAGWSAGEHILDTDFELAKNIINDALCFEMRVDQHKLPADLLKAYTTQELKSLSANNPSGFASAKQKKQAKELARERLEHEAKDGRYLRRKAFPVLWDLKSHELLFGATSLTQVDRLVSLFHQTFGESLQLISAGQRAFLFAEIQERPRSVDDSSPSPFVPGAHSSDIAWIADESSRDFLGNEFLLWLWFNSEGESDTVKLLDKSEATYMIARSLTLECPRGQTGHETISHEGPSRLPEAKRAIQSGKLPRKLGLTVVRHDDQYEFSLHAETLAIGSAKLPAAEDDSLDARGRLNERIDQIRHLVETVDLLFESFCRQRLSRSWTETLSRMQKWLARDERKS